MNAKALTCPPKELLADYGLGKLDGAGSETVSAHLETCSDCRQIVASVSVDSFMGRLREAHPYVAPAGPARSPVEVTRSFLSGESLSEAMGGAERVRPGSELGSIPAELAASEDYEVVKELGRGGMGVVYLARNRAMDRLEVLKIVSKKLLDRPDALERFQQEIRSGARLSHPNIVTVYCVLRLGELVGLAMEYVDGQDLGAVVKRYGPLPIANSAFYGHQVALGLGHAHEKGMVHRDIKPNNLILSVIGKKHLVKILDFGLAKVTSEQRLGTGLTQTGQVLGTPDYMSPEQIRDAQKADIRADIYSLGCTLYYLLSGTAPFVDTSLYRVLQAHQTTEAISLNRLRPEVPPELASVVARLMAKDPVRRYQTPSEVAKALAPFFKGGGRERAGRDIELLPRPAAAMSEPPVPPPIVWLQPIGPLEPAGGPARNDLPRVRNVRSIMAALRSRRGLLLVAAVLICGAVTSWRAATYQAVPTHGPILAEDENPAPIYDDDHYQASASQPAAAVTIVRASPLERQASLGTTPRDISNTIMSSQAGRHRNDDLVTGPDILVTGADGNPLPAVAPFDTAKAHAFQAAWARHLGIAVEQKNSLGISLVVIPPGEFMMGSSPAQIVAAQRMDDQYRPTAPEVINKLLDYELPQHRVQLSKPFLLGRTELTVGQFRRFVNATHYVTETERRGGGGRYDTQTAKNVRDPKRTWLAPGFAVTDESPAAIDVDDAIAFCNWLSTAEKLQPCYQRGGEGVWVPAPAGNGYRLPTEAEWEFACRAGTTTIFYSGDDVTQLEHYDWYTVCSGRVAHPVGQKLPNPFGLYDMHGNVHEWCQDWFAADYYASSAPVDPMGPMSPAKGASHVTRGGCFYADRRTARATHRGFRASGSFAAFDSFGMRIVRVSVISPDKH